MQRAQSVDNAEDEEQAQTRASTRPVERNSCIPKAELDNEACPLLGQRKQGYRKSVERCER